MTTLLLFLRHSDFLGEVRLDRGAFAHVMLTHTGESAIGPAVKEWQVRGVPVRRELFGTEGHPKDIVFYQERIQPRHVSFGEGLKQWCDERGIASVALNGEATLECWNRIVRLPLEPVERFAMLSAVSQADPNELRTWDQFLGEAVRVVTHESEKADEAIQKLHQKTAAGLVKRFAGKTA